MFNSSIKSNFCKKCQGYFKHEDTIALFKQHQYHFNCFICANCRKPLSHESFYLDEKLQLDISNPQVYCEMCYLQRCSPCVECNGIFTPTSVVVEFQGREYHQECFICSKCRSKLRHQIFYMKNNILYCSKCIHELEPCLITLPSSQNFTDQCKKCGKNFLADQAICMYQHDVYHSHCLRCGNCAKILVNEGFFRQEDGCFYCLNCHIEHGPHCLICKEPFLTGEILSQFDGKQFHSSCFLCDLCRQTIEMKSFCYQNGQIICENCRKE